MSRNRLIVRSDTTANWLATDPVLADRELVYDQDQDDLKIGDGTSKFSELPYLLDSYVPRAAKLRPRFEAGPGIYISLTGHNTILISTQPPVAATNRYVRAGYVRSGYVS